MSTNRQIKRQRKTENRRIAKGLRREERQARLARQSALQKAHEAAQIADAIAAEIAEWETDGGACPIAA